MTELAPFGAGALGRSERVHPAVRWLAVPIFIILLIGFALLYVWPADTERPFVSTIRPPTTALVLGAGYGAAAFFWWRVLTAQTWHHIGTGLPAIAPFTWAMALATLLHWDGSTHMHFIFRSWVVVHAATPLIVVALWQANRSADSREPDRDDVIVPLPVRALFAAVATAMLAVAVVMFARPALIIDSWAWSITPLTAQVLAGWFAVPGIQFMGMAFDRRWSAWRTASRARCSGSS